jgi:hypothetical protein
MNSQNEPNLNALIKKEIYETGGMAQAVKFLPRA